MAGARAEERSIHCTDARVLARRPAERRADRQDRLRRRVVHGDRRREGRVLRDLGRVAGQCVDLDVPQLRGAWPRDVEAPELVGDELRVRAGGRAWEHDEVRRTVEEVALLEVNSYGAHLIGRSDQRPPSFTVALAASTDQMCAVSLSPVAPAPPGTPR